jgi:hypothetical protein
MIREITRLREALDDLAMGAPRRVAFEALKVRSYVFQPERASS